MRIFIILFVSIIVSLFYTSSADAQNTQNCLRMNVSTQVVSGKWPGGFIPLSCSGDNGPNCKGTTVPVTPGQSAVLPNCSCPPYATGCLEVPASANGCTVTVEGPKCGSNGNTINPQVKISCPEPKPPVCEYTPWKNEGCGAAGLFGFKCPPHQRLQTRTPNPFTDACLGPNYSLVQQCVNDPTCVPPVAPPPNNPPPPVAPPPNNPPPNNPPPPVAPPPNNPPPPPANSPTPFPTPTPDFNNAMCKCDQMNVGQIALGSPIQVEAFAKVEGQDTSKAEVRGMKFRIYEGNASTGRVTELSEKGDQPVTVVSETPSLIRYRAEWSTSPSLKVGTEYRIVATPDCAQRTAGIMQSKLQTAVLAERDENIGFFGQIRNFFAGIFGRGSEVENEGVQIAEGDKRPIQILTDFFKPQQEESGDQIQLETFRPAQMEKEACNIVKFSF